MIRAPGSAKSRSTVSPSAQLSLLLVGREERRLAVAREHVRAIEADEVIDAVAVVQLGAAARALAQPREVALAPSRPSGRPAGPSSAPSALNASGGAPTEASSRNGLGVAHTSALSPSTMNGRSPNSAHRARSLAGRAATARRRSTAATGGRGSRRPARGAPPRARPASRRAAARPLGPRPLLPRARAARGTARSRRATTPARAAQRAQARGARAVPRVHSSPRKRSNAARSAASFRPRTQRVVDARARAAPRRAAAPRRRPSPPRRRAPRSRRRRAR